MSDRRCRDCLSLGIKTFRPAPHPGPRCSTHHREVAKQRKSDAHELYVCKTYGLQPGEYQAVLEAQGWRCAICGVATGRARKLACDHDHACCPQTPACGDCVRALLCSPCNQALGLWNTPEKLRRALVVLNEHPAQAIIQKLREAS